MTGTGISKAAGFSRLHWRPACTILAVSLAGGALWGQQKGPGGNLDATYSVSTQLVQIYLTVTYGGRRINGLGTSDFSLAEDGKTKKIFMVQDEDVPLDIALLLDASASMLDALPLVKEAASYFVDSLRPADRVTLIPFNTEIGCIPQRTDDHASILRAIRATEAYGGTRFYDALLFAMRYLDSRSGRRAIVSFSDGEDTAQTSSLRVVLNAAALYGFPIYTIGAGAGFERISLRRILSRLADVNSGKTFFEIDPGLLKGVFGEVAAELRSAYVLNYYTEVPSDGRWHDVSIALSNPKYTPHARRGFYAREQRPSGSLDDAGGNRSVSISPLGSGGRAWAGDAGPEVDALRRVLAPSPANKPIGSVLARRLSPNGRENAGTGITETLKGRQPCDVDLLIQTGLTFEAAGRTEDAYRNYRHALDCTLTPPMGLYLHLTRCARLLGRRVEADLFIRDYQARGGDLATITPRSRRSSPSGP